MIKQKPSARRVAMRPPVGGPYQELAHHGQPLVTAVRSKAGKTRTDNYNLC